MGLTKHGAKTSQQRQRKRAQYAKARCGKTGRPFLHSWNCPSCDPQSFPALRGKTLSGAPFCSRRQLPPTRRSPSRASQLSVDTLFMDSSVSTEREKGELCSPHLVAGRRRRTCGADSSISSASCTTADDMSASCLSTPCNWIEPIDTLSWQAASSTHEDVRDTMP